MGNKFYRLIFKFKELIKFLIVKYNLQYKLKSAANYLVDKTYNLRTKGLTKKQTISIAAILILSIIVILWPTKNITSPISTINNIESAILQGNQSKVNQLVNIDSIAKNMSNAIIKQISSKKLTSDLLSYMNTELKTNISNDFYDIVHNKGDFYKNLNNEKAILSKTLNFLFNKSGKITQTTIISQNEETADVEIVIFRPDLDKEIKVNLVLEYNEINWVVINIKDINKLLKELETLEEARIEKLNSQIKENFNSYIILKDFQKSELSIQDNSFLIRLSLENISNEDIKELKGKLNLIYKNQLIGTIDINIEDNIFANNFYEKAWSIKLKDYESLKNISKVSSSSIKATLNIEKIVFNKGTVLELIK
jgi:hypothetical protein